MNFSLSSRRIKCLERKRGGDFLLIRNINRECNFHRLLLEEKNENEKVLYHGLIGFRSGNKKGRVMI